MEIENDPTKPSHKEKDIQRLAQIQMGKAKKVTAMDADDSDEATFSRWTTSEEPNDSHLRCIIVATRSRMTMR